MTIDQTSGTLPSAVDLAAFRDATGELYALKERAFAAGDPEPIVTRFYAEDATTVGPDGVVVEGRAAFRAMYTRMVQDKTVRIESWNSHVHGAVGWDWTNFHVRPNDGSKPATTFIILFLWTRIEQGWICAGDMFLAGERPIVRA